MLQGGLFENKHARVIVLVQDICLNVVYKCMKFHCNISEGYHGKEWTRFCDGQRQGENYTCKSYGSCTWHNV